MVKAGHILKCNAARDFTSCSTAAWATESSCWRCRHQLKNFFPPHPPCIIGMRYADVLSGTLVLAKLAGILVLNQKVYAL